MPAARASGRPAITARRVAGPDPVSDSCPGGGEVTHDADDQQDDTRGREGPLQFSPDQLSGERSEDSGCCLMNRTQTSPECAGLLSMT